MFSRNTHQQTKHLHLYTSGFSSVLPCTTQHKRPSLEESFIMHSRLGLAKSHAPSHSLFALPPLKPPLIVLGTVVQVFSSLRGLCSMLPWHSMVAAPCHVPLTPCPASSDSVLVLCDACWDIRRGSLSSTCGLMTRIASSGFPRPSFEVGLSSRVPQVSAKRVRQSCSIKSRTLLSTITMYSMLARPRLTSRNR